MVFTTLFIIKSPILIVQARVIPTGSQWDTLCAFQSCPPYLPISVFTNPLLMISDASVSKL